MADLRAGIKFLPCLIMLLGSFIFSLPAQAGPREDSFARQRKQLVEHIRYTGVNNPRVLDAMLKVKRHLFVPTDLRDLAYEDRTLPIGEGQTISQPSLVALMTQLLELRGTERVLEIGTGSGYQAAVLAELAKEVYTIELLEPLARKSQQLLKELKYRNIKVKHGDGFAGWKEFAPYDAIIVTCAPDKVPPLLLEQLAENGRLVIPVGKYWQDLKLIRKVNGKIVEADIVPVMFVPLRREVK